MFWKKTKPLTKEEALEFLETQELSIEEISGLAVKTLGPLFTNERVSKQDEFNIWEKISEIEGVEDYFRDTMSRDLKRFFAAADQKQQDQVRGAYARTLYLRGLLNRKDASDELNKPPQLSSGRYADTAD